MEYIDNKCSPVVFLHLNFAVKVELAVVVPPLSIADLLLSQCV